MLECHKPTTAVVAPEFGLGLVIVWRASPYPYLVFS